MAHDPEACISVDVGKYKIFFSRQAKVLMAWNFVFFVKPKLQLQASIGVASMRTL